MALPTDARLDEKRVIELSERGWSAERIAAHFGRVGVSPIAEILRAENSRKAKAAKAEQEAQFCAAIRRREGSVAQLAARFAVGQSRAYRLAHSIFPGTFKPGSGQELPLETLRSKPEPAPFPVPSAYRDGLAQFLNEFCEGKLTLPETMRS
jgi:hypothetical protein